MYEISPFQYLSNTFTLSSNVTLPNIREGLVKMTFPSYLQYLNGSLSNSLRSLTFIFVQCVDYATANEVKNELVEI